MRPLSGIRVLDLSRLIPGPFASLVLADMGAQVDKVEDPSGGDYIRHIPPAVEGASGAYHALNRNKRSIVLDLKHPEGREVLLQMLPHYDIMLEQFRPGVLDRLGLGHSTLKELFPKLIICALTGYGQNGPMAHRAGHDLNYLARAGLLGFQGPENFAPPVPGWQMADVSGGLWSVIAILGALRSREHTGQGAILDIAMVDGILGFASAAFGSLFSGQPPTRGQDPLSGGIAPYNTYLSQDNQVMTLGALEPKFWMKFCAEVGLEVQMSDLMPGPHQNELRAKVAEIFKSRTRAQWEDTNQRLDCCIEPALTPTEIMNDPHLIARNLFIDVPTQGQPIKQYRTPVTPADATHSPAPNQGEQTDIILNEAGISSERIADLRQKGVVK